MTRNIVLVTVDSLRADYNELGTGEDIPAPTLRRLAGEGVTFESAIAPGPRTPSSVPVSHTGHFMSPPDDAWTWRSRRQRIREHLRRHVTLPEHFNRRGYTTVGITANPWTQGTGFDEGFDHFTELTPADMDPQSPVFRVLNRLMSVGGLGRRYNWSNKREWFVQWNRLYRHVERGLDRARADEPYFLWLFFLDTHQPYIVPSAYRHESTALGMYHAAIQEYRKDDRSYTERETDRLRRAYRDAVRSTDAFIERLHADTAADEPVFVFHSDHGEAFGEHGTYGHEARLYEENLRVPLFVHGLDRSRRSSAPFSLRRLPDLLCGLADDPTIDPTRFTEPFVFATTEDNSRSALRGERWKYLHARDGDTERLYDLRDDSGERTDLTSERPEAARSLRRLLDRHRTEQHERAAIEQAAEELSPPLGVRELP